MINILLTFDHSAIRGGYKKLGTKMKTNAARYQMPLLPSYNKMDDNYPGRHPHNIWGHYD